MKIKYKETIWLLLYGLIWGIIVFKATRYLNFNSADYMPVRIKKLQQVMDAVLGNGQGSFSVTDHNSTYYLYLAFFANICRLTTSESVFATVQTLAAAFCVFLYPVLIFYLFDKRGGDSINISFSLDSM